MRQKIFYLKVLLKFEIFVAYGVPVSPDYHIKQTEIYSIVTS